LIWFVMQVKELWRSVSEDGLLRLVALVNEAGELTCGFEESPWHTHGDLFDSYGVEQGNLNAFLLSITSGRQVIGVLRQNNTMKSAWLVDIYSQIEDDKYRQQDEVLQFRLWDGRIIAEFANDFNAKY